MNPIEALSLVAMMVALAAMPSSSVALVVAKSISSGRLSGAVTAGGIVAGDLLFVAMALSGMTVLAEQLGALFIVVKYCSGAYLLYLGFHIFRSRPQLSAEGIEKRQLGSAADFFAGLTLTLGDVKALLFYASLFPALLDLRNINALAVGIIVFITVLSVGGVKLIYVLSAAKIAQRLRAQVTSVVPQKIGGAIMIGCGCLLITKA